MMVAMPPGSEPSLWRRALSAIALPVVLLAAWYVTLVGGLLLPLTPRVSFCLCGALASAGVVWAEFAIAPPSWRARMATATALVAAAIQVWMLWNLRAFWSAVPLSCALAAVLIQLLSSSRKRGAIAAALSAAAVLILIAWYVDFPALSHPVDANDELELRAHPISAFHSYTLHDFLARGYLWRIDASTDALEGIAADYGMTRRDEAPAEFWKMAPYYWPRRAPEGATFYGTGDFPQSVGRSGSFMLIDRKRGRAYVWREEGF